MKQYRDCSASFSLFVSVLFLWSNSVSFADSWPTHLHDNQRTGKSPESLSLPLFPQWNAEVPTPEPAWPEPAKQDYWNRKTNLRPRIVHDRANGIVVADGRLVVGSSADDQVRAFDVESGKQIWTTFAEGPVRLAPTIWNELVVFASDDGFVYGVEAASGKLRWKTRPPQIGSRRIPGNGRIISERPIRSGVMVNPDGTGFFAAGIFPKQGAYFFSVDARSGKVLDDSVIKKSVQGYLEVRDGRIFAPTGRDPHGTHLPGKTPKGDVADKRTAKKSARTYTQISDAVHDYAGQENRVVALKDGEEVWSAEVDGRAYSLAIAEGRLFVSTSTGQLYSFGSTEKAFGFEAPEPAVVADLQDVEEAASSHSPGYSLYVSPSASQVDEAIRVAAGSKQTRVVIAVDSEKRAGDVRSAVAKAGVYGRVVVHVHESMEQLPYAERIFQRVIGGAAANLRTLSRNQESKDDDVDRSGWTHAYGSPGNTASSQARVGSEKMKLQWFGGPGPRNMVDRHMRTMPPLVSNGTMYIPGLDRVIAVDAFTGATLWEEEIEGSTRIGMLKDCGWMATRDSSDELFVAVDNQLLKFGTRIGGVERTVVHRVPVENRDWGYLACLPRQIVGSSILKNAARRTINRRAILEGAYSDNRPVVCSDHIFSFGNEDEEGDASRTWEYKSSGAILNPTLAATNDSLFFVENELASLEETRIGRIALARFWEKSPKLVALDLVTGKRKWSVELPAVDKPQNAFVICDDERVILVNSRNARTVFYDVRVFRASDGEELWEVTQNNLKKPGGDHGEQDKHPVLVGNKLIVEPIAYDLETGHKLTELNLSKRGYGCGTLSGSAEALFFRSGNPASYSLKTNKIELVTSVSRPGCWINMIPAQGLLLIPEGSSGCTCNFAVQTSMAFTTK